MPEQHFEYERLYQFTKNLVLRLGVPPEDAEIGSRALVASDLWGVESHGVPRLNRYAQMLDQGTMKAKPRIKILRESPISALVDGDDGWGMVLGTRCMNMAIEKAKQSGVGLVSLRNSTHFGMAGYYAGLALEHDLLGFSVTNSGPSLVPTFAKVSGLGTNPFSVAIPTGEQPPFLLDMSCTTVAVGKLEIARRKGKPMPLGWAFDDTGTAYTDDLEGSLKSRLITPLGGNTATGGHKGYGLSCVMEAVAGLLSGAIHVPHTPNLGPNLPLPTQIGQFYAALDIEMFRPIEEFKREMDEVLAHLHSLPLAEGAERIYTAGEKEWINRDRHLREGIALDEEVVKRLEELSNKYDIPL